MRFEQRQSIIAPTFCIASSSHRKWLQPILERRGWRPGDLATATLVWHLTKRLLPRDTCPVLNGVPNLLLLDDKAVLAMLTRRFTRTTPLVTHVLYGEWDDVRVAALRNRWTNPNCDEPRWWIIKDAHASNGFSTALFDRTARPLVKKDVAGGYCYVVQAYVERPMLIDARKFELRQYVLFRADGSAFTYDGGLIRLACVPYDAGSSDPRCHITNKSVQTGWPQQSSDSHALDEIERLTHDWPPYARLLERQIVPITQDLADAVAPLIASGIQAVERARPLPPSSEGTVGPATSREATDRSRHFELAACDLIVSEIGKVHLMEVNINPAFGDFSPRTKARLIEPLFDDLISLCILPAAGAGASAAAAGHGGGAALAPVASRWRQVRAAGLASIGTDPRNIAGKELREHQMYLAFKKSTKKKYERQFVDRAFLLSDVAREETPREEGKCGRCGCFLCRCVEKHGQRC